MEPALRHSFESTSTVRLLEAQRASGGSAPPAGGHLSDLPRDLLEEASRRLQLACLVWAGMGVAGILMNAVVGPLVLGRAVFEGRWPVPGLIVAPVFVVCSLGFYAYLRRHPAESVRALDLALAYEIFLAAGIALINQWIPTARFSGPSFLALLIVVYPVLVPNTPRKILATSLVAALMDPLAAELMRLRGVAVPPVPVLLVNAAPNFLAVALAVVQSRIFSRIGTQVRRARELGAYELGQQIGKGGMGEVWRASHRLLARPAAIKLISPQALGAATPAAAQVMIGRFKREAQAAASLQSPHAIDLFDFGVSADGTFYLVMELLDGIDLETAVRRFGPMPPDRAVQLLRQACHSLAEAHARGLVHRDIKPANIFLCRLGLDVDFIKVLDFGLAKWVEDGQGHQGTLLTAPEVTAGTPAYMPPEAALGERVDQRSDLYALGCVGYYLLTGQLVFQADSAIRMVVQHVNDPPVPPSKRSEQPIPPALDAVILACLHKKPEDRPADALTLERLLARAIEHDQWTPERARAWWNSHLPLNPVASLAASPAQVYSAVSQ